MFPIRKLRRLNISSYTLNIQKRLEFREISELKWRGCKPVLNGRGLQAPRSHCIIDKSDYSNYLDSGTFPQILACKHSSLFHPQMLFKVLSSNKEAICEDHLESEELSIKLTIQPVWVKSLPCWWCGGCINPPGMGSLHIWQGTINT